MCRLAHDPTSEDQAGPAASFPPCPEPTGCATTSIPDKRGAVATFVALLRGINVGANKRIAMADLRELLTGLGFTDVRTLLQSGNAVFTARAARPEKLAERIEETIDDQFGLDVRCLVR